jgi:hypothetical protein
MAKSHKKAAEPEAPPEPQVGDKVKPRPIRVDLRSLQRPLRRHGGYPGRLDLGRASNPLHCSILLA